jgi:RNA polymerase sigma-70 factor (ECF subfamily)
VRHETPVQTAEVEGVERVYREQAPGLWRALVAYAGDREIASDAVAEAFAQVIRRGEAVRRPERWVWTAGFRIAAGELKKRREYEEHRQEDVNMPEEAIAVTLLLRRLPEKQRAVIVLHYYVDLPNQRIAEVLGIASATVRVHLTRGRKRLKELLMEDSHA